MDTALVGRTTHSVMLQLQIWPDNNNDNFSKKKKVCQTWEVSSYAQLDFMSLHPLVVWATVFVVQILSMACPVYNLILQRGTFRTSF